jgi:hypothetical protein
MKKNNWITEEDIKAIVKVTDLLNREDIEKVRYTKWIKDEDYILLCQNGLTIREIELITKVCKLTTIEYNRLWWDTIHKQELDAVTEEFDNYDFSKELTWTTL